jgi:D-alanyl-lipoteichoic acid acyltransferase DltB (MBOAT superfamily)
MLFNSFEFLLFFLITTPLFFLLEHKYRWMLLLAASCFFYMFFKPIYILILAFTIVIDYFVGIALEKERNKSAKKLILVLSLIANIGILVVFKYWNFMSENLNSLLMFWGSPKKIPLLEILLPIGLSFHTFQAMSYTIEVYRGHQKAEKHFGIYSLYVMFYPQLVAGPIERPQNVLHQLHEKVSFSYANLKTGLLFILIGLVKKMVIADRMGGYVDAFYGDINSMSFIPTVLAIIFYSFQIYCDFSGYSSIAIGTAKCLGVNLMTNFDKPYQSQSIGEFWRRWHISLSTWFRDYVYFPLGGNRVSKWKVIRNISIVFMLSGIWHGANWTFVVWGGLHAIFLIFENLTSKTSIIRSKMLKHLVVFTLVSLAWIFFRSQNFAQAFSVFKNLTDFKLDWRLSQVSALLSPFNLLLCILTIPLLFAIDNIRVSTYRKHLLLFFIIGTLLIILFGKSNEAQFIYFQF